MRIIDDNMRRPKDDPKMESERPPEEAEIWGMICETTAPS